MSHSEEKSSASQHTPFDNPRTEAYWNRPCRFGKYPYPDENVFLVGGASLEFSVRASSIENIRAWAVKEQIQVVGVLASAALSQTIAEMKKVQQGELKGRENYARDFPHGEDLLESNVRIASWSVEQKNSSDDRFLRLLKANPNCSSERWKELEGIVTSHKEARHQKAERDF